jgi:large subunit ribosomal protein L32
MGAAPKTKVSRHRRGNRRQHQRLDAPTLVTCANCGQLMRAHRVCRACGMYRGRQVIAIARPTTDDEE